MVEVDLAAEVSAFIRERPDLIAKKSKPWVLFADGRFIQAFAEYSEAVAHAISAGLLGKFLVRDLYAERAEIPMVLVRRA